MSLQPDAWEPPNEGPPPDDAPQQRRARSPVAEAVYRQFQQAVVDMGLPPTTRFGELLSHCRARGAMSLLTYVNRNDPSKLSYDPDAELIDELAERLRLGDEVIRKRSVA